MGTIVDKLKEYLESPEGQAKIQLLAQKIAFKVDLIEKHIEWFLNKPLAERIALVKKVIEKYASDVYQDRWFRRGIEQPNDLFWEYFEYAQKKGEDVYDLYCKKYHRAFVFTTALYKTEEGFIVERLDGQGSSIMVSLVDDFEENIKYIHEREHETSNPEIVTEDS